MAVVLFFQIDNGSALVRLPVLLRVVLLSGKPNNRSIPTFDPHPEDIVGVDRPEMLEVRSVGPVNDPLRQSVNHLAPVTVVPSFRVEGAIHASQHRARTRALVGRLLHFAASTKILRLSPLIRSNLVRICFPARLAQALRNRRRSVEPATNPSLFCLSDQKSHRREDVSVLSSGTTFSK